MPELSLEQDITQANAEEFRQQLLQLQSNLDENATVHINWSGVALIDSTGLAVLLTFAQQMRREHTTAKVVFAGVQPQINRLLQMVRLQQLLPSITVEESGNAG